MKRVDLHFDDPEKLQGQMSNFSGGFRVIPLQAGKFEAEIKATRFGDIAMFGAVSTGNLVTDIGQLGYYEIVVPRNRVFRLRVNGRLMSFQRHTVCALNPDDDDPEFEMPPATRSLIINVFKPQLDDYVEAMSGRKGVGPVRLANLMQLDHPAGRAFRRYTDFLWSEVELNSPLLASSLAAQELESSFLSAFLLAADPFQRDEDRTPAGIQVRRAVSFIMDHLSEPLSLGGIAAASGVHAKTLQRAFQKEFGWSVMAFVRERRLEKANNELLAADPALTTVTDIAIACGFWHLGRFSQTYRQRFGERPSGTLRRIR